MINDRTLFYKIHELDEQPEISCPVGHIITNEPVYQHIMTCEDLKLGLTKIYYLCQFQNYHIFYSLDDIVNHQNTCNYNFEKIIFNQQSEFIKIMIPGDDTQEGIQKYQNMANQYQQKKMNQIQEKQNTIKYVRNKILNELKENQETIEDMVSFNVNQFTSLFKGIRIDSYIYKWKLYRNYYQEKKFKENKILIKDFNNFYDCRGLILNYLKLIKTEQDYYKYMVGEFIIPQKFQTKFNQNFQDIYKFAAAGLMSSEVLIVAHRKNLIVQNYMIGDCAVLIFSKLTETSQYIICNVKTDPEEIAIMDTYQSKEEEKRKKEILLAHQKYKQDERDKIINGYYQNIRKLEEQLELISSQIIRNRDNILDRTSILNNDKKSLQNKINQEQFELNQLEITLNQKKVKIEQQNDIYGSHEDEDMYRMKLRTELTLSFEKFQQELGQIPAFKEVSSEEEFQRRQALFHSTVQRNLELEKRIQKQEFQIEILETILAQDQNIVNKQNQKINQMIHSYDFEYYKKRKCQVCLDRNASYVNIPCGCTIYCGRCLLFVTQNQLDQVCVQCGNVVRSQMQMDF